MWGLALAGLGRTDWEFHGRRCAGRPYRTFAATFFDNPDVGLRRWKSEQILWKRSSGIQGNTLGAGGPARKRLYVRHKNSAPRNRRWPAARDLFYADDCYPTVVNRGIVIERVLKNLGLENESNLMQLPTHWGGGNCLAETMKRLAAGGD